MQRFEDYFNDDEDEEYLQIDNRFITELPNLKKENIPQNIIMNQAANH